MVVAEPIATIQPDAKLSQASRRAREVVEHAVQHAPAAPAPVGMVRIEVIELSEPVAELLVRILDELANGRGIAVQTIVRGEEEVSTSQAARMLGMSRPTLINLLEKGDIPYRKVGTHRRVPVMDLLKYRAGMRQGAQPSRAEKLQALEEMADYADRLGLGY